MLLGHLRARAAMACCGGFYIHGMHISTRLIEIAFYASDVDIAPPFIFEAIIFAAANAIPPLSRLAR